MAAMTDRTDDPRQILIPTVIEQEGHIERAYDIYSRLLKDRIIFLGGRVDRDTANLIIAQMLFLDQQDVDADVRLYINSPGGSVPAGLAIFDTMNYIKSDVHTICVGQAASMGAFLLANGAKGKRFHPAARQCHDSPALDRRHRRTGDRYRDYDQRIAEDQEIAEQDIGRKNRPVAGQTAGAGRAGLLAGRRRVPQIRLGRQYPVP